MIHRLTAADLANRLPAYFMTSMMREKIDFSSFEPVKPQKPADTRAPFDDPRADIILRSSDNVDFRVHILILSMASDFFKVILHASSLSQQTTGADGLPLVPVPEPSHILDILLRSCYPRRLPLSKTIPLIDIGLVLDAAQKYHMNAFDDVAGLLLMNFVDEEPVTVYAIACCHGLKDVAAKAALCSLKQPFMSSRPQELDNISGTQMYDLLQYHRTCGEVASAVASSTQWLCACSNTINEKPLCTTCYTKRADSQWWAPKGVWDHLAKAGAVLKEHPYGQAIYREGIVRPSITSCRCGKDRLDGLVQLWQLFATEVDRVVSEVRP